MFCSQQVIVGYLTGFSWLLLAIAAYSLPTHLGRAPYKRRNQKKLFLEFFFLFQHIGRTHLKGARAISEASYSSYK